tara:strand:+ start:387 stop:563 length:177 start_codon:yes stop_codon:yes gene_type:complete
MPENKRVDDRRKLDKASAEDRRIQERRDTTCPEKLEPHHEGRISKEGLEKIKKSQGRD